jgi:hypothetical protein
VCLQVVDALVDGTVLEEDPDERDVESRAHCVMSLGRVCETLMGRLPPLKTTPSSTAASVEATQNGGSDTPANNGGDAVVVGSSEGEADAEPVSGAQAPTAESRKAGVRLAVDKVGV